MTPPANGEGRVTTEPAETILADLDDLQTWAALMAGRAPRITEVLHIIQRARIHIIECRDPTPTTRED